MTYLSKLMHTYIQPMQTIAIAFVILFGSHTAAEQKEHASSQAHSDDTHNTPHDHSEHNDEHTKYDDHNDHDDHGHHNDDHNDDVQINPAILQEFGVVIETASLDRLTRSTTIPGEVVHNDDLIAHVTPSVTGKVLQVFKTVGDSVKAGDIMAILSSKELATARSDYLANQARLDLASELLARNERLLKDKVGTQRQTLEAKQAFREAQIALHLSEQHLLALGLTNAEILQINHLQDTSLSLYELRSPIKGLVTSRDMTLGEVVPDQPEQSPFIVADYSSVWVDLSIYQRDLAHIRPGMPVDILFGHDIPNAQGTIAWIGPILDHNTRTATARVILDNPEGHWRPGLFVKANVGLDESDPAILVPNSALQVIDEKIIIFAQTDHGLEPRPVQVGLSNATHTQILDGLAPGDLYVSKNAFTIKADMQKGAFGDGHNH